MKQFASEEERLHWLALHGAMLTGSVAFGVDDKGSDIDWLVDADTGEQLRGAGYKDEGSGDGVFEALRDGIHNYIVALNDDFYCRWVAAHNYCLFEKPKNKERRIEIFRYYLYGEINK